MYTAGGNFSIMNKIPVDFVGVRVLAEKENGKRVISNSLILSTATAFLQRTGKEAEFIFIGGDPPSASLSECGAPTHSSMAALQPRDGFAGRSPSSEAGDGDRGSPTLPSCASITSGGSGLGG